MSVTTSSPGWHLEAFSKALKFTWQTQSIERERQKGCDRFGFWIHSWVNHWELISTRWVKIVFKIFLWKRKIEMSKGKKLSKLSTHWSYLLLPFCSQLGAGLNDLLMEPPSYEEARLHAAAPGTQSSFPPPSYDHSFPYPSTPPPTYGEAGEIQSHSMGLFQLFIQGQWHNFPIHQKQLL